jgi:hypothetical protein
MLCGMFQIKPHFSRIEKPLLDAATALECAEAGIFVVANLVGASDLPDAVRKEFLASAHIALEEYTAKAAMLNRQSHYAPVGLDLDQDAALFQSTDDLRRK